MRVRRAFSRLRGMWRGAALAIINGPGTGRDWTRPILCGKPSRPEVEVREPDLFHECGIRLPFGAGTRRRRLATGGTCSSGRRAGWRPPSGAAAPASGWHRPPARRRQRGRPFGSPAPVRSRTPNAVELAARFQPLVLDLDVFVTHGQRSAFGHCSSQRRWADRPPRPVRADVTRASGALEATGEASMARGRRNGRSPAGRVSVHQAAIDGLDRNRRRREPPGRLFQRCEVVIVTA